MTRIQKEEDKLLKEIKDKWGDKIEEPVRQKTSDFSDWKKAYFTQQLLSVCPDYYISYKEIEPYLKPWEKYPTLELPSDIYDAVQAYLDVFEDDL